MASPTWFGTQATKLQGSPVPSLVEEGDLGGRVLELYDSFTLAGALTSGDVINMSGRIPEGARITAAKMVWTAQGGSGTLELGWAASPKQDSATSVEAAAPGALLATASAVAAGKADMFTTDPTVAGYQHVLLAPVQIQVTVPTAGTATTGTIQVVVSYVID